MRRRTHCSATRSSLGELRWFEIGAAALSVPRRKSSNADPSTSARLVGASDAQMEEAGVERDPYDQARRERVLATLEEWLEAEELDRLLDEGRAMTLDEAVEYALAARGPRRSARERTARGQREPPGIDLNIRTEPLDNARAVWHKRFARLAFQAREGKGAQRSKSAVQDQDRPRCVERRPSRDPVLARLVGGKDGNRMPATARPNGASPWCSSLSL